MDLSRGVGAEFWQNYGKIIEEPENFMNVRWEFFFRSLRLCTVAAKKRLN